MDVVSGIWHCLRNMGQWLFFAECKNAGSLLSVSFAVNSTNFSLSRFNLCAWLRRKVSRWVKDTLDDQFLTDIGRLGKGNEKVAAKLGAHSSSMECFVKAMETGPAEWERSLRKVTTCCAFLSFICMAFDIRTRIGVVLISPYLVFLLGHTVWTLIQTGRVVVSRRELLKAKDEAERKEQHKFDVDACTDKLRAVRTALSSGEKHQKGSKPARGKPPKARTPRKAAKT